MRLSLTVAETNVLRLQVGLQPIPVEGKSFNSNVDPIKIKSVKDQDGILSITLAETNQLRKRVGLEPIPESMNYTEKEYNTHNKRKDNLAQFKKNLGDVKSTIRKKRYLSKGGVLDRDSIGDEKSWLLNVGNNIPKKKRLHFKKKTSHHEAQSQILPDPAPAKEEISQPKPKRKVIILEDSDDEYSIPSDYKKPKKFKRLKTIKREEERKRQETFHIDSKSLKKIELVDHDLRQDDNKELNSFLNETRQHVLKASTANTDTKDDTSNNTFDGLTLNEDVEFLNKFGQSKKEPSPETARKQIQNKSNGHPTLARDRVTSIIESETMDDQSLGISGTLDLLKNDDLAKDTGDSATEIQLVYKDDKGHVLNTKQAYKYLSHKFHGFSKGK